MYIMCLGHKCFISAEYDSEKKKQWMHIALATRHLVQLKLKTHVNSRMSHMWDGSEKIKSLTVRERKKKKWEREKEHACGKNYKQPKFRSLPRLNASCISVCISASSLKCSIFILSHAISNKIILLLLQLLLLLIHFRNKYLTVQNEITFYRCSFHFISFPMTK